jgi:PASTA domain
MTQNPAPPPVGSGGDDPMVPPGSPQGQPAAPGATSAAADPPAVSSGTGGDAPAVPADEQPTMVGSGVMGGSGGTSIMPAIDSPAVDQPAGQPRWSARAQVPSAAADAEPEFAPVWPAEPGRGSLLPVLITLAVLILLGLTGLGIWLILRANSPTPVHTPSVPAVTTPAPHPTTTAPATSAPATTAPATSAAPKLVTIPDLRNADAATALATLTGLGLQPVEVTEPSTEFAAGHVIRTDPAANAQVSPGSQVKVYASIGAPTSAPATPSASGSVSSSP